MSYSTSIRSHNLFRFSILVCFLLTSCAPPKPADKTTRYKEEAKAFCEVYNPQHWKDHPKDFNFSQLYVEIGSRISKVVESAEFSAIFSDFNKQREQDFYHFIKHRVSELQGEPFACQYYEDFYNAINVSEANSTIPIKEKEINIVFNEQGKLSINSSYIASPDTASIKTELVKYLNDKPVKIVIHKNQKTTDRALTPVFDAVAALGITRLSILEPEKQQ